MTTSPVWQICRIKSRSGYARILHGPHFRRDQAAVGLDRRTELNKDKNCERHVHRAARSS